MSKALKTKDLTQRSLTRVLVAATIALFMAAFGCTTDRQLGNGDPVTTPGLRTNPGTTYGSETASTPPPMMSSYSGTQSLQRVTPRSIQLSADEAAAVMAQHQPTAVKVLGPVDPGSSPRPYASMANPSGQFMNPALRTNPQLSINSSISSQPVPAVTTGAGEVGAGTAVVGSVTDLGINANLVTNPTVGNIVSAPTPTGSPAPVFLQSATVTPTNASPLLSPGAFTTSTLSPTASSVVNPPASVSATPRLAAVATRTNTTTVLPTAPPVIRFPTLAPLNVVSTPSRGTILNPVRIVRNSNGRVVVTNTRSQ